MFPSVNRSVYLGVLFFLENRDKVSEVTNGGEAHAGMEKRVISLEQEYSEVPRGLTTV